ncbi:sulfur carrier protein ThiS [Dongia deserti]|uniref:sulfur carrier protein ThiS n=1 Tax=Dongia deserti TaxID=2268030 RepID=UPI000E6536D6|nr:sulfur carrier protein ThiS [Dongia deserti]
MTSIAIILNGAEMTVETTSLAQLLADRGVDERQRFVAVAVNNLVMPRSEWASVRLAAGDRVEIVQPMKGG